MTALTRVLSQTTTGKAGRRARVPAAAKPGGSLSIAAHGPMLYWEAVDTTFAAVPKRFVVGYRVGFWPRDEDVIGRMRAKASLIHVSTERSTWKESFENGSTAYEFFCGTSAGWWYSKMSPRKIPAVSQRIRDAFERRPVTEVTTDVIFAQGYKP